MSPDPESGIITAILEDNICGCGEARTPDLMVSGYLMLRTFKFSHSIQTVFTEPVTVYGHLLYLLSYASINEMSLFSDEGVCLARF